MVGTMLFAGVWLLLLAPPASAHDNALTASVPPASATLASPPQHITLSFRWRVRPGSTTVTVLGPDGVSQWQQNRPSELGRTIDVGLRNLGPAGQYAVHYRGLSMRGYPFQGTMVFVLAPPSHTDANQLPLIWIASVVLLTAGGTALGVRLGRSDL
jgi:methionine-rich copper-binding protein CopC